MLAFVQLPLSEPEGSFLTLRIMSMPNILKSGTNREHLCSQTSKCHDNVDQFCLGDISGARQEESGNVFRTFHREGKFGQVNHLKNSAFQSLVDLGFPLVQYE
jgi:hypothetical protein